jgi:uncharacterized protein (TIGR02996 family)
MDSIIHKLAPIIGIERTAFISKISDNIADVAPWLIFADYLDERDDLAGTRIRWWLKNRSKLAKIGLRTPYKVPSLEAQSRSIIYGSDPTSPPPDIFEVCKNHDLAAAGALLLAILLRVICADVSSVGVSNVWGRPRFIIRYYGLFSESQEVRELCAQYTRKVCDTWLIAELIGLHLLVPSQVNDLINQDLDTWVRTCSERGHTLDYECAVMEQSFLDKARPVGQFLYEATHLFRSWLEWWRADGTGDENDHNFILLRIFAMHSGGDERAICDKLIRMAKSAIWKTFPS